MMVLPFMPKILIKGFENVIRDFLWDGKKSKIAFSILQNPKDQGGLGLVNFKLKEIALKATWPQILQQEEEYATLVYRTLKCDTLAEDIWRCSLAPEDASAYKSQNKFWVNTLMSWGEYNFLHERRIENQLLWYNSSIRIKDKPFFWRDSYVKGLRYVYQLFEDCEFKTQSQVWEQYGITALRYNSLKSSFTQNMERILHEYRKTVVFSNSAPQL